MTQQTSYTYTVEQRYGKPFEQLVAPDGYEFTGEFRPPISSDIWLDRWGYPGSSSGMPLAPYPILILSKKPKRKRIVYEQITDNPEIITWSHVGGYSRREEEF